MATSPQPNDLPSPPAANGSIWTAGNAATIDVEFPSSDLPQSRIRNLIEPRRAVLRDTNRFTIDRVIGEGGFGRVLAVRDIDLKRTVAFKTLKAIEQLPAESKRRQLGRFVREAQVTAQLSHPGIIPVHDFGFFTTGEPYFSMPLFHGEPLDRILDRRTPATAPESFSNLIDMFLQVCDAIAYAHDRGVVHGDIKPSNILVGSHGDVRVVDWGIARLALPEDDWDDGPKGTLAYMAPEQLDPTQGQIGPRTDVFLLGGVLFHILVGKPPNWDVPPPASIADYANRARQPRPSTLSQRQWLIPQALARICDRALSADQRQRFTSAVEFGHAIRAARDRVLRGTSGTILIAFTLGVVACVLAVLGWCRQLTWLPDVHWLFFAAIFSASIGLATSDLPWEF